MATRRNGQTGNGLGESMKSYFLCRIIGTGGSDPTGQFEDPFRPAISDVRDPGKGNSRAFRYKTQYPPQDPNTGQYESEWCLVVGLSPTPALARNNPDIIELMGAEYGLVQLDALQTTEKVRMLNELASKGFDLTRIGGGHAVREVIDDVGKQLWSGFNSQKFDVED